MTESDMSSDWNNTGLFFLSERRPRPAWQGSGPRRWLTSAERACPGAGKRTHEVLAMKTLLILGGYAGTGRRITRRLLEGTNFRLVVAGRRGEKADRLAKELNGLFPGRRVTATAADAADPGSLRAAFRGVDLVLVCLPTIRHTEQIARATLAAGLDYLDLHFPAGVVPILKGLEPDIRREGRCFISQAGFHPGLLAPLVKFAAPSSPATRPPPSAWP
jgi:hypothetical protein